MIDQRNNISAEYYKNKMVLDERKYKKLTLDRTLWEIDAELCQVNQLDIELVKQDPDIAKRFMITDVS